MESIIKYHKACFPLSSKCSQLSDFSVLPCFAIFLRLKTQNIFHTKQCLCLKTLQSFFLLNDTKTIYFVSIKTSVKYYYINTNQATYERDLVDFAADFLEWVRVHCDLYWKIVLTKIKWSLKSNKILLHRLIIYCKKRKRD